MKPATARTYGPNANESCWAVYQDGALLAEFDSESYAKEFANVPKLVAALRDCIEVLEEHRAAPVTRGHANALLRELGE